MEYIFFLLFYRNVDMLNVMSYDLHGSWETHTGHNSGLFMHTGETGNDTHLNVVNI
jgi:chitinase